MQKVLNFLKGKKTYIIAAAAAGLAFAAAMGWQVPEYLTEILIAFGLVAARAGAVKE